LKNAWTTSRQVNFFWVANFNLKFGEKGLELENQDPEFQISGEITEEDFENLSIESHVPVFIFCQTYREKEYRESEYWTSNTKLILGGNHHYLQWSESEKIAAIIRELSE
ncbi:hypothetical protein, partial [Streptococcus pneumoniae]|uniref:hypothetical protein n=1 Tax=Streptococcus pneumoniae TaxID=1313 RepID=UPI00214D634C